MHMESLAVQIPVLDFNHLQDQTFGDAALERELLTMFRAQALEILSDLRGSKLSTLERGARAHLLRGSALAIGASRVAATAAAFESSVARPAEDTAPQEAAAQESTAQGSATQVLLALADAIKEVTAAIDRRIATP